ncbi:MAG TPA: hypothetical protein VN648_02905, partial [Candidatus Methylomirabilis sp.]|nr:hypothetical protein [Candidatus Methylomirabilis sp.]
APLVRPTRLFTVGEWGEVAHSVRVCIGGVFAPVRHPAAVALAHRFRAGSRLATAPAAEKAGSPR